MRLSASLVAQLVTLAACSALSAGCASADSRADSAGEDTRRISEAQSAVINGAISSADDDAVILLARYDAATGEFGSCTGTMIAENLVLTARHCVAKTDEGALCTGLGKPINGGKVYGDYKADTLYVFTGVAYPKFGSAEVKPAGRGIKIFSSGSNTLCNNDIALVQLAKPIKGVLIKPLRLDTPAAVDETIRSVGFGLTEKGRSPSNRIAREGVKVVQVGAAKGNTGGSSSQEFEVGESICSGDSGGPAISEKTGAVLGVVSRGGNPGADQSTTNRAANCVGADTRNIYTSLAPFKDFILETAAEVSSEVWLEGGADPRLAVFGATCSDGAECRSGICTPDGKGATFCSKTCEEDACGDGLTCRALGGAAAGAANVCQPPVPAAAAAASGGGCSTANAPAGGASGLGASGLAAALVAIAAVVARRRRHAGL